MLRRSRRRDTPQQAPEQPAATPAPQPPTPAPTPAQEYAMLGSDAPIAWPSVGGRRVPVTGQLSPHAAEALKRMGITKE
jgi:hypothetical protein